MVLSLIRKNIIKKYELPSKIDGSYWIDYEFDQTVSINVEAVNGAWVLRKSGIKIINDNHSNNDVILKDYQVLFLQLEGEEQPLILCCSPIYDNTFRQFAIKQNSEISIGSDSNNQIVFKNNLVSSHHTKLIFSDGHWIIQDLNSKYLTYVNGKGTVKKGLISGDIIFIMGLKIIIMGGFIVINNPNNQVYVNHDYLLPKSLPPLQLEEDDLLIEEEEIKLYSEDDYFLRSPRLRTSIERVAINIDSPPAQEKTEDMPLLYTIGPMITMGMTSMVMGGVALNNVMNDKQTLGSALPTMIISGAMLLSMILWPLLTKKYQKKQQIAKEKVRQEKYSKYIDSKRKDIQNIINLQRNILVNNYISLEECRDIILNKKENLWERKIEENDFLKLRIGRGTVPSEIDITYPEKHFTLDDDNLRENLDKLINESKDVADVPICIPLTEKYTTAIVGIDLLTNSFIDGLLLQLMTFHSYEDLKIVFFTNEKKAARWEYLKILPHCWTDDKEMRFFATNPNEMQQVSNYLESIFNARKYKNTSSGLEESNRRYDSFSSYYVIITDDLKSARNIKIIKDVLGQKINGGFSLLIKNDKLSNLPNECSTFIEISEKQSGLFENELLANNVKGFHADFNTTVSMQDCVIKLANVPIELSIDKMMLPKVVTFLEMYDAGKIEQLNIFERWKINNPVISLQVPIGINESGELFKLDLHEKFHGPHGLIAGMTGSGKSELIITYLLSLAVNYHPDEVNFILIDYKGGSVAGAFENKEAGIKIPHMVGTITNLDTVELKRSLVSIESELKRRQRLFNKVREALNESTIDIYKYQRLYREGLVDTPISHLLIVSDEFAELKLQQPEFMSQLISTARIGRSLGVHLILATQKPSGIVDDQIWSNSRFRVCMKVQEKADSMDMIKCSDAAMLKDVGRFYLQVGYNEFFALGHSAWCGSQYIPMDKRKKKVDTAINFIDNTGYVLKHIDSKKKSELVSVHGDELGNVVKYLSTIAKREGINVTQLWLDKIPEYIYVGDLKAKYGYKASPYLINPIIGEFDDPSNQRQGLLTLNITVEGNTVVYGVVGSGKELILSTIIYSIIMEHTAEEVNFYILDFGAETLRNFNNAPQVANILSVNDSEEIDNLFKLLKETIEIRKKLFLDYNGDYRLYCQKSGKKLPTIIVIINYYDSFIEAYQEYEDILLQLTRDGLKCGIIFILTTAGINTIRYRLLQNFKQQLTLQLNDNVDYNTILGNVEGVYPSKHKGRGLIRIEKVYEFQTAYPYNKNNMGEYIKVICQKLRNKLSKQAERIPVLPEVVDEDFIYPHIDNLTNLPIGVEKNSLKVLTYNLQGQYGTLISAQNIDITSKFITSLMKIASQIKDINVIILDAERLISKELLSKVSYYNNNFDSIIDNLYNQVLEQYEAYTSNHYNINYLKSYLHTVCFLVGIDKLKKRLATEISTKFDSLLEKGRDLNKFSFILVEEINRLKVFEYDNWFKILINKYDGIWVGRGITEQFILKLGRTTKDLYEEIGNDFGYAVNNGMPTLVKLLDFKLAEEVIINDPEKIEILDI